MLRPAVTRVTGLGASELDAYAKVAATEQKRTLRSDPEPEKGFYYRSDHFNSAKQGMPAFAPGEAVSYVGKPTDFVMKKRE